MLLQNNFFYARICDESSAPLFMSSQNLEIRNKINFSCLGQLIYWGFVDDSPFSNIFKKLHLLFQVTGGGQAFRYHVEPEDLAMVSSDGKVNLKKYISQFCISIQIFYNFNNQVKILSGPGLISVTTGMASSMHNNFTSKVEIIIYVGCIVMLVIGISII